MNKSIDYSQYSVQKQQAKRKWTPPVSEGVMNDKSNKLAISTRCYPEYLLAAYGFLQQVRQADPPKSLSDLMYKIVCDYINQNIDSIGTLPDAETALDFLLMQGWITSENRENYRSLSHIRRKQTSLQERIDTGNATDAERFEYWQNRDPEKAEQIIQQMTNDSFSKLFEEEEEEEQPKTPAEDNSATLDPVTGKPHTSGTEKPATSKQKPEDQGIAGLDVPEPVASEQQDSSDNQ